MKTPLFWSNPPQRPGWKARLLAPLGMVYAAATKSRLARGQGEAPGVPVICIGNINAGGTGKTPVTIALMQRLSARGITAHVVSRGYGGTLQGPILVSERNHKAADCGDEPLLLAAFGPTWVARDRAAGARAAVAAGAQVVLLDDGFQNPCLHKDLNLVVVDARAGFGNERALPAGPLREDLDAGLSRADLVIAVGDAGAQAAFAARYDARMAGHGRTVLQGALRPLQMGMDFDGLDVLAFAGIGHPEKFFATLRGLGANLIHAEALADHQPLTDRLMLRLSLEAKARGAQLVTTEKDAVRLPQAFRQKVLTLPVRLEMDDWSQLDAKIDAILGASDR